MTHAARAELADAIRSRGSYVNSLVLTDIASEWKEAAPIVVREGSLVVETPERIRGGLPFALRALDVDNSTEFRERPADRVLPESRNRMTGAVASANRADEVIVGVDTGGLAAGPQHRNANAFCALP
jgi:hypothetical protein